ncbi:MAG: hypothetical protein ACXVXZ_14265 [Mycobacteriaceae bacterium]
MGDGEPALGAVWEPHAVRVNTTAVAPTTADGRHHLTVCIVIDEGSAQPWLVEEL